MSSYSAYAYTISGDGYRLAGSSSSGTGGSNGTWGGITGTLTAQTDLQSALNGKVDNVNGLSTGQTLTNATLAGVTTLQNHGGWTYGSSTIDTYNADRGVEYASTSNVTSKYGTDPLYRTLKMVYLASAGMGTSTDPAWTGVVSNGSATLDAQQTLKFTYTIPAGEFGKWDQITIKGYTNPSVAQAASVRHAWYIDDVALAIGTASSAATTLTTSYEVSFFGVGNLTEVNYTNPTVSTFTGGAMYLSNYQLLLNKSLDLSQSHTLRVDVTSGTTSVRINGFSVIHRKLVY